MTPTWTTGFTVYPTLTFIVAEPLSKTATGTAFLSLAATFLTADVIVFGNHLGTSHHVATAISRVLGHRSGYLFITSAFFGFFGSH